MSIEIKHSQLTSRDVWQSWIDSITDLALSYDVWKYCDPATTEEAGTITNDTIRTGLRKVNERITITVHQKYRIIYAGIHTPRGKLQALKDAIQPTTQDQKDQVRSLYEIQKKGP
ncbi:hypothetical protein K402DRAFT_332658, partial [Aulographum hederae CBS 113979]